MFARQLVLLIVSIVGILGIVPAAFILWLGLAGDHETAEKSRAWAEGAVIICAAFIIWEVVELTLAKRAGVGSIVRVVVALVLTGLTAAAYLLVRLVML